MYCLKCGSQLPDDAAFCSKCGARTSSPGQTPQVQSSVGTSGSSQILALSNAQSLKCPSCGAPIAPKFGEMIITCEYCGSSITLGSAGWANIQKQTMLPLTIQSTDEISGRVKSMMGRGMGGGGGQKRAIQMDQNYNFPIIALKALTQYQPRDYQFAIQGRTLFDIPQYPKGIKVLNGDISEDAAKYQAKTLVDQL